jgi:hypothetical protein
MALSAMAMAVTWLATVDTRVARGVETRLQALAAADAALETTIAELSAEADWNEVLAGARASTRLTARPRPVVTGWGVLDVAALTMNLQRETEARSVWAGNTGVWRMYLQGVPAELLSASPKPDSPYVIVWVSDDEAEADADPERDGNGLVVVRAEAFGPGRAHARVVATVRRRQGGAQIVSWRTPVG